MQKNEKIVGLKIYLRELILDDVTEEYCSWLNDPKVNKYLETRKSTLEDLKEYVKKQISDPLVYFFGIFYKDNDVHIGNIKLRLINSDIKKVDFGILIGNKDYWCKGIGAEATKVVIDYAFNYLGFNEISLGVMEENIGGRRLFEKCGFKYSGVKKGNLNHSGILYDEIVMIIKK